ncbi:MAG TPA: AraC family transcriptional regulator [Clostridiales bacterium]|nr:AraC family transcriptional regulator [Clostridiales bacterium]
MYICSPTSYPTTDKSNSNKQIYFPVRGKFEQQQFKPLIDQLDYLSKRKPFNILRTQAIFLNILDKLASLTKSSASETRELAIQIMDFIAENFNKPLTWNHLSKKFNYSPDYLARIMKKHYGITLGQYIQEFRINKAKELLANTDYPLSAISREVGYSDVSLLYKAFRNQEGIAPGIWRTNCRGVLKH